MKKSTFFRICGICFLVCFFELNITKAQTTVVLKAGGSITVPGDWGDAPTGTVNTLTDFSADHVYSLGANNTTRTLSTSWGITSSSTVNIGDGTNTFSLVYSGTAAMGTTDANIFLNNKATLTLNTPYNFNSSKTTMAFQSGTVITGGTIIYALGTSSIATDNYYNLSITENVATNSASVAISGTLAIQFGKTLLIDNSGTLTVTGNIINGGSIASDNTGTINYTGIGDCFLNTKAGQLSFANVDLNIGYFCRLSGSLVVSNSFKLSGGGKFQLKNTLNLNLNGNIDFGSVQVYSDFPSTINIGGSGAITGSLVMGPAPLYNYLSDLVLNRNGAILSIGSVLNIVNSITPTSGTINTNGKLVLFNSTSAKGRVGIVGATGALVGNTIVQLFRPVGVTGWVNLCPGGVSGKIFSDWNSSFAITCPSGCPNGSVVSGQAFTSVYSYSESLGSGAASGAAHYVDLPGTTTAIDTKAGYWIYLGNGYPNSTAMTLTLSGAVNTKTSSGAINISLTGGVSSENGWNLIANPYPSPILVSQIISTFGSNIDPLSLQAYDPDINGYVILTSGGTKSVIPMGQAFYVRALANAAVLPDENWKTASAVNVSLFRQQNVNAPPISVNGTNYYFDDFLIDLQSNASTVNFFSQAYFSLENGATLGYDLGKDSYFMDNPIDPSIPRIFSMANNEKLLRNALTMPNGSLVIPVQVITGYTGSYTLRPMNISKLPEGACVMLHDLVNNTTHDFRTGAYSTTIIASQNTPQFELIITLNQSTINSQVSAPLCLNGNDGSIVANGPGNGPWNYYWKDANGSVLQSALNVIGSNTLTALAAGVYQLEANSPASCDQASSEFTLNVMTPLPIAQFSGIGSTGVARIGEPVIFTNGSQNASYYAWDFGDGAVTTGLNTSHVYDNVGSYQVTLIVNNGFCQNFDNSTMQVEISDAILGIDKFDNAGTETFVYRELSGLFLKVNALQTEEVTISAFNGLGQMLLKEQKFTPVNGKIAIPVPASNNLLFIKVSAAGETKTYKVVH